MENDDDDLSKTMVIPNPGGRWVSNQRQASVTLPPSLFDTPKPSIPQVEQIDITSENILLACASELINLASNLITLEPSNSTEQLRHDINSQIEQFDNKLNEQGKTQEVALTARYLLCCLLDELVLRTPWGIQSSWSRQTLLSKYHNETSGGEKFFVIVNKLMEQAQRNIDLIELSYLCLSVGFRGKYQLSATGENDILQIGNMMHQAISLYRPSANELSPSWRVETSSSVSIEKRLPASFLFIVLTFICIAVYIALLSNLHAQSSVLYQKIESIGWSKENVKPNVTEFATDPDNVARTVQNSTLLRDIRQQLSTAINAGLLTITQQNNVLILRFVSANLFASGSTNVNEQSLPNRTRLINAIKTYTNSILIVGHTDSSGKAESNWVISRLRAESIERWIKSAQEPILQTTTRGVADTQALAEGKNDSRNRRVEILIFLKDDG